MNDVAKKVLNILIEVACSKLDHHEYRNFMHIFAEPEAPLYECQHIWIMSISESYYPELINI